MNDKKDAASQTTAAEIMSARGSLELMLLAYGNVNIETLGQLLALTRTAEIEYSHICARRLCN